MILSVRRAVQW